MDRLVQSQSIALERGLACSCPMQAGKRQQSLLGNPNCKWGRRKNPTFCGPYLTPHCSWKK